jgi:ribosomal protein L16 Arg81 hydroxylase
MPVKELHRWVGDVDHFMATYFRRQPVIFDTAPPAPMTLHDLDAAMASGLLRTPHVDMVKVGEKIPADAYTGTREVLFDRHSGFADGDAIVGLLKEGATLLLRDTEQWHRPTAQLVQRLQEETGRLVQAFFFVTPPGGRGLEVHRDDADVFLLQVAGSKAWTVRTGPGGANWKPGPVTGDPGPVLLEATVTEGQVLYIPRGYAHAAVGEQGLSVHLSLTVREVGAAHLARAVAPMLIHGVRLPSRPLDEDGLLASATALLEAAREQLATVQPHDLLRYARAAQRDLKINETDPSSVVQFAAQLLE